MQHDLEKDKEESNEYEANAAHPSLAEFFQNSRIDAFGFIRNPDNMFVFLMFICHLMLLLVVVNQLLHFNEQFDLSKLWTGILELIR